MSFRGLVRGAWGPRLGTQVAVKGPGPPTYVPAALVARLHTPAGRTACRQQRTSHNRQTWVGLVLRRCRRAPQGIPPHELLEARLPSAQQLNEQQEKQPPATSTTAAAARSSTGVQGKRRGGGGKAGQAAAAGVAAQQQQPGEPSHPPPPPDVVSGGVALLRRRVQRLASLVATGRVGIQVRGAAEA